jgi:hypothetical protein
MAGDFAKNDLHSVRLSDIAWAGFGSVDLLMMSKLSVRILISAFALILGTQVLFGQVLCDLQTSMPCCPSNQDPAMPPAPDTTCCVISAPETGSQFTVAPKAGPDLSDLKIFPARAENLSPCPVISHSVEFLSWHCLQYPFDSPEKLSVFRI